VWKTLLSERRVVARLVPATPIARLSVVTIEVAGMTGDDTQKIILSHRRRPAFLRGLAAKPVLRVLL
jgi:hypothetical protein